jgi:UDP-N-acetylglucosamine 2-epimerase (non-hydrolysing)
MLDQVLSLFEIEPDFDLDLMRENQSLSDLTARVFTHLDPILKAEKPDWVLVQGDTTTVMAASLVSFYHQIKIGHVEAGLRTFDKWRPFPEEVNRKIAGVVADAHFAPTTKSQENLLNEGVDGSIIYVTGNPVIDALKIVSSMDYDPSKGPLKDIPWDKDIVLITAHRRENFGQPIRDICSAISELADKYSDRTHFVYPVHLNPHIQEPVYELLGNYKNITLVEPLDYLPLVQLMKRSYLVLTDSGGIQEEAPGLGKPVLVLRQKTERPEAVEAGTVKLVGTDPEVIMREFSRLMENPQEYKKMSRAVNPYGDGKAAGRIVDLILAAEE